MFGREPALWLAALQAGLALAIGFGTPLTAEQVALILAFSAAILGLVTRSQVVPTAKINPVTGKVIGILLVFAMIPTLTACAVFTSDSRHRAVVAETAIAKSLFAVQDLAAESAQAAPEVMTPERFKEFNRAFVPVLELGLQVNRTVRALPAGAPAPDELRLLVTQLKMLTETALRTLPEGDVRTKMTASIQIALDAALAVYNSLPQGGTQHDAVSNSHVPADAVATGG